MGRIFRPGILLVIAATFACSGCFQTTNTAPAAVRYDETQLAAQDTELARLKARYDTAIEAGKFEDARVERDRMIFLLRVEIDRWYSALEQDLHESRASFNSWGDFWEFSLAGAGAVATPPGSKTIFASILSVTKGTRISIDKNWFREKATESLINAMRAGRSAQLAIIISKMTDNAANRYTYEEAWGDLISYHQAGTIQGGLVTLATNAGEKAAEGEKKVAEANKPRYTEINAEITAETATENGAMRENVRKMNLEQRRKTLEQIDGQAPASTEEADVKALIQKKLDLLFQKQSAADRKKIIDAIKANTPTP